jgi:hypothetical protein
MEAGITYHVWNVEESFRPYLLVTVSATSSMRALYSARDIFSGADHSQLVRYQGATTNSARSPNWETSVRYRGVVCAAAGPATIACPWPDRGKRTNRPTLARLRRIVCHCFCEIDICSPCRVTTLVEGIPTPFSRGCLLTRCIVSMVQRRPPARSPATRPSLAWTIGRGFQRIVHAGWPEALCCWQPT